MVTNSRSTQQPLLNRVQSYWPIALIATVILVALALYVVDLLSPAAPVVPIADVAVPVVATAAPVAAAPVLPQAEIVPGSIAMDDLLKGLFRQGIRPEGPLPTVDVLLSAPVYFAATSRTAPEAALAQPSILFYVTEDAHEELPTAPPAPILIVDGAIVGTPAQVTVLADSFHHRTTLIRYAAVDTAGQPLVTQAAQELLLEFPAPTGWTAPSNLLRWELPIVYTADFSSWQVALGMPPAATETEAHQMTAAENHVTHTDAGVVDQTTVQTTQVVDATVGASADLAQPLTWVAVLAIMAGMLTALSPCLIQLVLYFTATLTAVSTEGRPGSGDFSAAQRHIMLTGLFFAGGFTLVYTAGGAAAGYIGQSMDRVGVLTTWARPISIGAGVIILVMALRVAWNVRAPLVCRLPMAPIFGAERKTGVVGSVVMGISFAMGCLACFSATILPALLLYAGTTGSVVYGATLLLVFSLGITVPCLVLAFGMSKLQPLVARLRRAGPYLGLASALVMASFGIIMVTDQFHLVSSLIFRYLNLG